MKMRDVFDLQRFADTNINAQTTGGSANPYTGATETNSSMAPEMKTFYNTALLQNARPELYYLQLAKKQALPKKHGRTVEFRKFATLPNATALTEGVVPDGKNVSVTNITDSLAQYGMYVAISDVLDDHAIDDVGLATTEELAASMGKTQDELCRDDAMTGTNVMYCSAGGTAVSSRSALTMDSKLTGEMVAKAVTILKKANAPKINGKYVAVVHPSVAHDLRQDSAWVEAHKYAAVTEIFNGEIGELHGVRFVETSQAKVIKDATCPANGSDRYAVYCTLFVGKDAYGVIDPEGGNAQMIIKNRGEAGGPLEQFSTMGYKFETNGAVILYQERMLRVESLSSFSADDPAN